MKGFSLYHQEIFSSVIWYAQTETRSETDLEKRLYTQKCVGLSYIKQDIRVISTILLALCNTNQKKKKKKVRLGIP